jgi:WD40 repeat protein
VARGRPEDLLWDGASYREYGVWRERYPGGLSAAEEEFAVAMTARAGRRRRRRRVLAAVLVAALATVAVTVTALWRRAEHQARRVEARRLFEVGRQSLGRSPPTALAWAIASLERADDDEARRLALAALQSSPMPTAVDERQLPGRPVSAVFSPDGQWLAVGHFEGAIALWPASGRSPRVWQAHRRSAVPWIAPGSQTLLSLGFGDPHFALWTLPGAERIGMVERQDGFVQADLEAREASNPVRLVRLVADPAVPGGWNVDPRPARAWRQLRPPYPTAAVTPDGGRLVFADGDGLYEVEIAEQVGEPRLLGRNPAAVEHVTFHPDGARFATFDVAGVARVWSAATAGDGPLQEWQGPSDTVCDDLRFDPSGRSLAAAFGRGDALLWDLDAPPGADPLRLAPAGGDIIALAFHPGGRFLATAALAQLAVWPLDRETYPQVLRGHSGRVDRVAFSPDAAFLVSAGSDGTVRRWPLTPAAGVRPRILYRVGHPLMGAVASVAVSPDGGFVVACTGEASARVIPLDGSAPRTLGGFDQRVLRAAVGSGGRVVAIPGVVGGRLVVRTWDLVSGESATLDVEEVHRPEAVGDWLELATTPHGGLLVTSGARWCGGTSPRGSTAVFAITPALSRPATTARSSSRGPASTSPATTSRRQCTACATAPRRC